MNKKQVFRLVRLRLVKKEKTKVKRGICNQSLKSPFESQVLLAF